MQSQTQFIEFKSPNRRVSGKSDSAQNAELSVQVHMLWELQKFLLVGGGGLGGGRSHLNRHLSAGWRLGSLWWGWLTSSFAEFADLAALCRLSHPNSELIPFLSFKSQRQLQRRNLSEGCQFSRVCVFCRVVLVSWLSGLKHRKQSSFYYGDSSIDRISGAVLIIQ